ncbi:MULTISPECIES: RNA 2',3'-cyclic phosphodiesterase [Tepidanaerobacter]|uniref:RNA 2',3'-cyclic phosphodiesterase n=1 Tax=Tepidanaerobacter TaxID=499228 RepID=UPI000A8CD7FB|nr:MULTISPECIES: RNA 2',3'-cyclic phosphodiesterase [Tepidanaerobacter]
MRCFISIEIESSIKKAIGDFIEENNLRKNLQQIRWVNPENLHITLAFLGEVAVERIPDVKKIVAEGTLNHHPFTIKLEGLGCFPDIRRPRVVWIGIKDEPELLSVREDINKGLDAAGIFYDKKPFLPHLTIGRVKSPIKIQPEFINKLNFTASFPVQEIFLMESNLSPKGASYTVLFSSALGEIS